MRWQYRVMRYPGPTPRRSALDVLERLRGQAAGPHEREALSCVGLVESYDEGDPERPTDYMTPLVVADDLEGLRWALDRMGEALRKPVLDAPRSVGEVAGAPRDSARRATSVSRAC